MIYISVGVLQDAPTIEKGVIKCGSRLITLEGEQYLRWLNGRFGFVECEENDNIIELQKLGLIVIGEENTYDIKYDMFFKCLCASAKSNNKVEMSEQERAVYQWLKFSPYLLDIADILSLFERNIKIEAKYIGEKNGHALIKLIYEPHGYKKNNVFYNRMFNSEKRNDLVDIFETLIAKRRLVLLGRKDNYG